MAPGGDIPDTGLDAVRGTGNAVVSLLCGPPNIDEGPAAIDTDIEADPFEGTGRPSIPMFIEASPILDVPGMMLPLDRRAMAVEA